MDFTNALQYVYENRRDDGEIAEPFLLYCRLCDLCGANYEDKHKVELFYQVDKKLRVMESVLSRDRDVLLQYDEVAELLGESNFQAMIHAVKRAVGLENEFASEQTVRAVITEAEKTEEEETRTPLVSSSSYYGYDGFGLFEAEGTFYGLVGVFLLAVLGILALIFRWEWTVWQWLIGIVGGVAITGVVFWILNWLEEEVLCEEFIAGLVALGIAVVINFVLLWIFHGQYKIIFSCFSVIEILLGIILTCVVYEECEDELGGVAILETAAGVILMIVGLIWL